MKTRVFITGANGFIGSNLCEFFSKKGWEVFGLVRESSDLHFLEGIEVNLIYGDLFSPQIINFPDNIDYFIHNASIADDNATFEECRSGIFNLTRELVKVLKNKNLKKFIYVSTGLTLGFCSENISEIKPGKSTEFVPYARFKKKTEEYLRKEHETSHFPVVIIRPGDVYGPKDRISSLKMLKAMEGGLPIIVGRGLAKFAYCYVENLCSAIHKACVKEGILGRSYTITNTENLSWKDFFNGFYQALGKKQRIYVPIFLIYSFAYINQLIKKIFPKFRPTVNIYRIKRITSSTTYDITRTVKELDLKPDNNFDKQIKNIVNWYNREKKRVKLQDIN